MQGAGTPGYAAEVAASRSVLSKLVTNTAGKFVRFSTEQLKAKYAGVKGALDNVLGVGNNPITPKLGAGDKASAMAQRALQALQSGTVKVPAGLTREAAEAYLELARRAVAAGKDIVGTQAARAELLDWILSNGLL